METINVNLSEDSFIHFTYADRARRIIEEGVLLANPPHKKFGIEGVQAVSVNHGQYVPNVQLTHLRDSDQEIVALHFRTRTMPKVGYPEEVIWHNDVELIDPQITSKEQAVGILSDNGDEDDYQLIYESALSSILNGGGSG